jgi:hypothetical protein
VGTDLVDDGKGKRGHLAGARLGRADDIAARQQQRDGLLRMGVGLFVAHGLHRIEECQPQAEFVKLHARFYGQRRARRKRFRGGVAAAGPELPACAAGQLSIFWEFTEIDAPMRNYVQIVTIRCDSIAWLHSRVRQLRPCSARLCSLILLTLVFSTVSSAQIRYSVVNGTVRIDNFGAEAVKETVRDIIIPATLAGLPVTAIGPAVFQGRTELATVTIPDSVRLIGQGAFSGCTGLSKVTILNSATTIGDSAFPLLRTDQLEPWEQRHLDWILRVLLLRRADQYHPPRQPHFHRRFRV